MCLHSFPSRSSYIHRLSRSILHGRSRVRQQHIGRRSRIQGLLCMCLHSFPSRHPYIRSLSGSTLDRRSCVRQQLIGSRGRIQGLLCMCLHSFPNHSPYIRRLSGNILHRRPRVRNLRGVGLGSSDDRRRGRTSDFLGGVSRTACYRTDPLPKSFWGRLYLIFEVFNLLAFFHFTPHKSVV